MYKMFGHCVWYTILKRHKLNKLIYHLSEHFNTDMFQAHITLHSRLNGKVASNYYVIECSITKPWFHLQGRVYQTKTVSEAKQVFYALQQDYIMYNEPRCGTHHVSLAYRLNKPFTKEEISYANSLVPVDSIWSSEIYVSLNNCNSVLPKHWQQLKCHVV